MWSEQHKYPLHSVVVTSPAAIDSSNKCLEMRYMCLQGMSSGCRVSASWGAGLERDQKQEALFTARHL